MCSPFDSFTTENAVVWIDPLDGTSDYCRGNISAVTVLVGLTINDRSRAGVVHVPFAEGKDFGETFFGTGEHGAFKVDYHGVDSLQNNTRTPLYLPPYTDNIPADFKVRVAVSSNRPAPKEQMDAIAPSEGIGLGGCGNKCATLI